MLEVGADKNGVEQVTDIYIFMLGILKKSSNIEDTIV